jgi:non-heme chloroperoxidase
MAVIGSLRHVLALLLAALGPTMAAANPSAPASADPPAINSVQVNDVELHFTDEGSGAPVVFVHGGLADYRELVPVARALPTGYRTVTYSRRYSFPNSNGPPALDHTMEWDVDDLAGLIESLDFGPAHVVGTSYGAYVALLLGLRRPDLVVSVTAAEPPLLHWLPDIDGGSEAHDHFLEVVMRPSAAAFASGDPLQALTVAVEYFAGPGAMEELPAEFREMLIANLDDWQAITTAPNIFPPITRDEMSLISRPVLIISGGETAAVHRLIDPELARAVRGADRIVIPDGSHDMCAEQPEACARAIDSFMRSAPGNVR